MVAPWPGGTEQPCVQAGAAGGRGHAAGECAEKPLRYDENLDAFYDYEKYGTERMNAEDGMFTDRGYIAYKGYISTEEVMNGGQSNHMVLGGLSR